MYRISATIIALFSLFVFQSGSKLNAQEIAPPDIEKMRIMEDSMLITIDSIYNAYLPESHVGYSERLIKQLVKALRCDNSYIYPFSKIADKISIIYSDDSAFRIFNWMIDYNSINKRYYGAVQLPSQKLKLFGLSDYSAKLEKGAEDSILTGGKWMGALYYRILATDYNGGRVYTCLGFSEASPTVNRKIMDPIIVTENGITFGAPIIGIGSKTMKGQPINRFLLEYKKGVSVTLNWDKEKSIIVCDDLTSQINDPNRKYTFVPSGQYNAFYWNDGMWNFKTNILPIQDLKDGEAPTEDVKK